MSATDNPLGEPKHPYLTPSERAAMSSEALRAHIYFERNRIKRRLRAACQMVGKDAINTNMDVVIIGRRDILSADFDALIDDLRRALRAVSRPKGTQSSGRPTSSSSTTDGERRGYSHA